MIKKNMAWLKVIGFCLGVLVALNIKSAPLPTAAEIERVKATTQFKNLQQQEMVRIEREAVRLKEAQLQKRLEQQRLARQKELQQLKERKLVQASKEKALIEKQKLARQEEAARIKRMSPKQQKIARQEAEVRATAEKRQALQREIEQKRLKLDEIKKAGQTSEKNIKILEEELFGKQIGLRKQLVREQELARIAALPKLSPEVQKAQVAEREAAAVAAKEKTAGQVSNLEKLKVEIKGGLKALAGTLVAGVLAYASTQVDDWIKALKGAPAVVPPVATSDTKGGDSTTDSIDEKLDNSISALDVLVKEIADLQNQLDQVTTDEEKVKIQVKLDTATKALQTLLGVTADAVTEKVVIADTIATAQTVAGKTVADKAAVDKRANCLAKCRKMKNKTKQQKKARTRCIARCKN